VRIDQIASILLSELSWNAKYLMRNNIMPGLDSVVILSVVNLQSNITLSVML
jgi:hypothetical protein